MVELLVAATMTIIAVAMIATDVLPGLRALEQPVAGDHRHLELATATEVVARAVRSARPDIDRVALDGDERTLVLSVGPDATVRVTLEDGRLVLAVEGVPAGADALPAGQLVAGLDMSTSAFALIGEDGSPPGDGDRVAAVVVTLDDGERTVVRAVGLRLHSHLDGALPW